MLSWPITTALESRCFDRVIVSTDDEEIAQVARGLGAEVPFLRPTELADDYTPTLPVIVHAIETLTDQGVEPLSKRKIYGEAWKSYWPKAAIMRFPLRITPIPFSGRSA
jgi:N-acylneuraminate cytidylyltransferase